MLVPGLDVEDSQAAIRLASEFSEVFAAVGVHPNSVGQMNQEDYGQLLSLADRARKVVAVGEIGLDYHWDTVPRVAQREAFVRQLALAKEANLPVIIHNRDATDDVILMLENWTRELISTESALAHRPGVLHSFSGTVEDARRAIDIRFMLGISGPITFRKSEGLREIVREVGLEWLLIETDSPFLSPEPVRGRRNEPANVARVAEAIGEILNVPAHEVAEKTAVNAARLFEW